jgi:hypothetical protein
MADRVKLPAMTPTPRAESRLLFTEIFIASSGSSPSSDMPWKKYKREHAGLSLSFGLAAMRERLISSK